MVIWVEGSYPDSAAKVALVATVGRHAKRTLVSEWGVGEELAMNIMGWCDDQLGCIAQMDLSWGNVHDEEEKMERVAEAAVVMRRGWGVDSFTFLAEAYVSVDPGFSAHKDLVDAFLEDDGSRVNECLSICHVGLEEVDVCAIPFRIKGRNKIQFGNLLRSDSTESLRNAGYVSMLAAALRIDELEAPPIEQETFHLALATGLAESAGFFIQYDL